MKIVIAGNYIQYKEWLSKNQLCEKDAVYAESEERLMGIRFREEDIVRTGEYWKSKVSQVFLRSRMF